MPLLLKNVASQDMRRTQTLSTTTCWNKTTPNLNMTSCWKKTTECRLLTLPPELRNNIWHCMGQTFKTAEGAIEIGNKTAESPAILLTCKQIRGGMLQMYHHDDSYQYTDGGSVTTPDEDVPLTKWLQHKHDNNASIKQLTLCFEKLSQGSVPKVQHALEWYKESVEVRDPVWERHEAATIAAERIFDIILSSQVPVEKLVIKGPEWIYSPQWYKTLNFGRWWTRAMLQCVKMLQRTGQTTLIGDISYVPILEEAI